MPIVHRYCVSHLNSFLPLGNACDTASLVVVDSEFIHGKQHQPHSKLLRKCKSFANVKDFHFAWYTLCVLLFWALLYCCFQPTEVQQQQHQQYFSSAICRATRPSSLEALLIKVALVRILLHRKGFFLWFSQPPHGYINTIDVQRQYAEIILTFQCIWMGMEGKEQWSSHFLLLIWKIIFKWLFLLLILIGKYIC